MKRNIAMCLLFAMLVSLLSGCDWGMTGELISVEPYEDQNNSVEMNVVEVTNSSQMYDAVVNLVESGSQSGILSLGSYSSGSVHFFLDQVIQQAKNNNPMCAYAVDEITYEIGTRGGAEAVALKIQYRYELSHILRIKRVSNMQEAIAVFEAALVKCEPSAVIRVPAYEQVDINALMEEYALSHPNVIMEVPQIKASAYPETGEERIVEVTFTYETDREDLLRMQGAVETVFTAAELYVRNASQVREKYAQMYAFLMERSDYTSGTSVTPAYSLLVDGYGDCEAFARVFAAMCQRAELECYVVAGTRDGQPWIWNLISFRGSYYHLDLLRCSEEGEFLPKTKSAMEGYTWDQENYPD